MTAGLAGTTSEAIVGSCAHIILYGGLASGRLCPFRLLVRQLSPKLVLSDSLMNSTGDVNMSLPMDTAGW
jgi:hypothetical protein